MHGTGEAQIDYRHIIGSLVRKPGAFARYRFRESMFPTQRFRLAYDALCGWRGERADVEYVRILHLAATTMESKVDRALERLLESGTELRLRDGAQAVRSGAPSSTGPEAVRYGGPRGVRPAAGGRCTMMADTAAPSAVAERVRELCRQFKLPTLAAETVGRFSDAGHTDALVTLVEVMEQEAEDRRVRRVDRLRRGVEAAGWQDLGHLRARQDVYPTQTAARETRRG